MPAETPAGRPEPRGSGPLWHQAAMPAWLLSSSLPLRVPLHLTRAAEGPALRERSYCDQVFATSAFSASRSHLLGRPPPSPVGIRYQKQTLDLKASGPIGRGARCEDSPASDPWDCEVRPGLFSPQPTPAIGVRPPRAHQFSVPGDGRLCLHGRRCMGVLPAAGVHTFIFVSPLIFIK